MKKAFLFGDISPWKYFLLVSLVLGGLFAMMQPTGTTERGLVLSIIQWLAQSMIPMGCCISVHVALHRLARFDHINPWFKLIISGLVGALLFSPAAYAIDLVLGDALAPDERHSIEWIKELAAVLLPVSFSWVAINIPFNLGYSIRRAGSISESGTEDNSSSLPDPVFFDLLAPQCRGGVMYMKSELHYLSVTTTQGHSLILYTLRDAIGELPPGSGIQTHRSHWANLSHIKKIERTGRTGRLIMDDGTIIPVSRTNISTVTALLNEQSKKPYPQD